MFSRTQKTPPGPSLFDYQHFATKLDYFRYLTQTFGDVIKISSIFKTYLINNPEYVQYILQNNNSKYPKGGITTLPLRKIFGNSILILQGKNWQARRHLAQPSFHPKVITGFSQFIVESTLNHIKNWDSYAKTQKIFDLNNEILNLIIKIEMQLFFGLSLGEDDIQKLMHAICIENKYAWNFFGHLAWLPTLGNLRFIKAHHASRKIINKIIHQYDAKRNSKQLNLFYSLIEGIDDEGNKILDSKSLFNEIKTFLLTGHETTAATLSAACFLLLKNPHILKKLQQELQLVLQGKPITYSDIPKLSYAQMVIEETLRLYPPYG